MRETEPNIEKQSSPLLSQSLNPSLPRSRRPWARNGVFLSARYLRLIYMKSSQLEVVFIPFTVHFTERNIWKSFWGCFLERMFHLNLSPWISRHFCVQQTTYLQTLDPAFVDMPFSFSD